jgi:hypothetical protein
MKIWQDSIIVVQLGNRAKKKQAKQRFYDNINEHLDDHKTVNSKMYWKTIHMLLIKKCFSKV